MYEYAIILLEPPHRSPLSLSLLLYLYTHFRLLSLTDFSLCLCLTPEFPIRLFPSVHQYVAGQYIMAAIICVTVTACPLITVISYISLHCH